MLKILITEATDAGGKFLVSSGAPKAGKTYALEDTTTGTNAQNRAFHALCQEYWRSNCYPRNGGNSFAEFRDIIKRDLGEGFEKFIYVEIDGVDPIIKEVKTFEEIPEAVRKDKRMKEMILGKLKSWTRYTVGQRKKVIDNLADEMIKCGVNSKKFDEILRGLDEKRLDR